MMPDSVVVRWLSWLYVRLVYRRKPIVFTKQRASGEWYRQVETDRRYYTKPGQPLPGFDGDGTYEHPYTPKKSAHAS